MGVRLGLLLKQSDICKECIYVCHTYVTICGEMTCMTELLVIKCQSCISVWIFYIFYTWICFLSVSCLCFSAKHNKDAGGYKGTAHSSWWRRQYHLSSIHCNDYSWVKYIYVTLVFVLYLQPMVVRFQEVMNEHLRNHLEKLEKELQEKVWSRSAFPVLWPKL